MGFSEGSNMNAPSGFGISLWGSISSKKISKVKKVKDLAKKKWNAGLLRKTRLVLPWL
jgi:hypothetical protein